MTKNIKISVEAYERIIASMKPGESISDTILRIIQPKNKKHA